MNVGCVDTFQIWSGKVGNRPPGGCLPINAVNYHATAENAFTDSHRTWVNEEASRSAPPLFKCHSFSQHALKNTIKDYSGNGASRVFRSGNWVQAHEPSRSFGQEGNTRLFNRASEYTFGDIAGGTPLKTGIVIMESGGQMERGEIDADGKFVMGFESKKDGIPKGKTYTVTIVNAVETTGMDNSGMLVDTPLIDPKYSDSKTSGLTFTADGSSKTLDLKVDRYKK